MLKIFTTLFFFPNNIFAHRVEDTNSPIDSPVNTPVNKTYKGEMEFMEEDLTNNYGTIILKEITEEYIIYICSKEGLLSVININKNNFTISKVILAKSFKKKKIPHPTIVLSSKPTGFTKKSLEKYTPNINISPIIRLVEGWDMIIYNNLLKILHKTFYEALKEK
jgi:hypothetical protein